LPWSGKRVTVLFSKEHEEDGLKLDRMLTLAAVALFGSCLSSGPAAAQVPPGLRELRFPEGWIHDDWDAARKLAESQGKPIFAVFRCVP
jgi:hypothetical protein